MSYEDRHPQDRNEPWFRFYQMVLKRIEQLMDAKLGTPDGAELVALSALAKFYEDRAYPELSSLPPQERST